MEKNPDVDICSHLAYRVNAETKEILGSFPVERKLKLFTTEDVIIGGGGDFVATNSLFMKSHIYTDDSGYRSMMRLDYIMQIAGSLNGGMLYIDEPMSAYRVLSKNAWTSVMRKDTSRKIGFLRELTAVLREFNKETNYEYQGAVEIAIQRNEYSILTTKKAYKEAIRHAYFKRLSTKEKLKMYIKFLIRYKK